MEGQKQAYRVYSLLFVWTLGECQSVTYQGPQALSEHQRQRLGTVLIEPNYDSEISASGITTGKGMGMAKGAGGASAAWLGASLSTGEPFTMLVGVMLTPVATLAGGVYGGVVADRAKDVETYVATLDRSMHESPGAYRRQLLSQLAEVSYVDSIVSDDRETPHNSRLEVNFVELRASGGGPESELLFTLYAQTQLFVQDHPLPVYIRDYETSSPSHRLSMWADHDGSPLNSTIDQLAGRVVARILDDHFRSPSYVVSPVFPAKGFLFKPPRLKTSEPTFRWQTVEGQRQLASLENSSLTYELQVFDTQGVVYEVEGLVDQKHQFTQALPDCESYNWHVRGHYEIFEQPRTTEWSTHKSFRTPCGR